ncbi:hypothetical protein C162_21923 [Paenibacillus sp. FSL R7-269]|nr:hypothetical protein C162_21923 [Paenibacillus sp. FSL R7-269]
MTEGANPSETLKRIVGSIGEVFRKLWKVVKAFVRKLTRTFIFACRNVTGLKKNVRIYFRTKNRRIKRKQQQVIFTTLARLI